MGADAVVGRDAELGRLGSLVRAVAGGQGGSAWVEGEPGIGKSALLGAGLAAAPGLGCLMFRGAATELDRRFPLRVLLDSLKVSAAAQDPARRRILASLGDGPAGPGSADLVPAVAEGLLGLVEELCAQPLVLVVDDLHWADEASLLVWQRLTRMTAQLPLLLVAACRPVPRRAELVRLRWGVLTAGTELVELGPLADGPVAELVGGLLGAHGVGTALRRTVARAAGNPLYVREMVDALVRERRVLTEAGTVELTGSDTDGSVPLSLVAAISDRLDFLSGTALGVLRSASLVGTDFSVTELALLTGRSASELAPTVEETVRAGVLAEAGVRLGFRHPLIRQVLYDSTPAALRFALHRQAARTLADASAPPEQVAEQLLAALPETDVDRVIDDWVPDWLAGPGRALTYRAPQVAAELLDRTVRHAELRDARREELQTLLASVLIGLSRRAEAAEIADHVRLTSADPTRAAEAAWTAAVALYGLLQVDEAGRLLDAALAAPGAGVWTVRMRALRLMGRMMHGDLDQIGPARAALAAAEEAGDRLATAVASNALCGALHFAGETAAAVDVVTRELALLGDDPRTADLRLQAMHNQVSMLGSLDRLDEADGVAREMLRQAERYGTPARLTATRCGAAEHHFQAGHWDQAVAVLETATEDGYLGNQLYELVLHGLWALIAAHRDDEATAQAHLDAADGVPLTGGVLRSNAQYLTMARAVLAERAGDRATALAIVAGLLGGGDSTEVSDSWLLFPVLARLAIAAGRPEAAMVPARGEPASRGAAALHCHGLLATDPTALLEAAEVFRAVGRPGEQAAALEDAATVLAAAGDLVAARSAYAGAAEQWSALGAEWDLRRADSRLRRYGVRRRTRRRPTTGWDALTPTELRVAFLVTDGHSNPDIAGRLFLSRRTVDVHVSHILAKLTARSRVDIAREALKHQPSA